MTGARAIADAMTWSLARQCRPGDVLIYGVGTPLAIAAGLLARELLVEDLTIILAGCVDPDTHDVAETFVDPASVARRSAGSMTHTDILDAVQRGAITLQFVAPAQVDGAGRVNVSRVPGRDGALRRLSGPIALPDVTVVIGRLVAYRADHSPRVLVPKVDYVTGAGNDIDRTRHPGSGVGRIVTGLAEIEIPPEGALPRLASLQPGATLDAVIEGCGFELDVPADVPVAMEMPAEARTLLDEVIDPRGIRLLEVPAGRRQALAELVKRA